MHLDTRCSEQPRSLRTFIMYTRCWTQKPFINSSSSLQVGPIFNVDAMVSFAETLARNRSQPGHIQD